MKRLNQSLAFLILITGLSSPLYVSGATLMLAQNADGGGDICTIPATRDLRINLNNDEQDVYGCKNDQMSYFKLDNVRSAVYLTLRNDTCGQVGSWAFQMKTIIDPITTPWISIESLKGQARGHIVTRGVIMAETGYNGGDQIRGKLTCVIIDVSEPG